VILSLSAGKCHGKGIPLKETKRNGARVWKSRRYVPVMKRLDEQLEAGLDFDSRLRFDILVRTFHGSPWYWLLSTHQAITTHKDTWRVMRSTAPVFVDSFPFHC